MIKDQVLEFTSANRIAWDETEERHRSTTYESLLESFSTPGFNYLGDLETRILEDIGLEGKSVVQLACNNGRETLSIRNLGAARCTGFDISENFIRQGSDFAEAGNISGCELVACDVYQIPDNYHGQYDLVFISVGALMLMPDLALFFEVAAKLLKAGGQIFIYERHPMLGVFEWDDKGDPPTMTSSYFDQAPRRRDSVCDYWTKSRYECSPMFTFHHKLSDVFQALLRNGFSVEDFEEYDHDVSEMYVTFEKLEKKPPLSYTLIGRLV